MSQVERQELARPDPQSGPVLGDSRAQVLAALRAADDPCTVADVADRVGLHQNTARFHLDGLVEQGLADRETEQRDVPGRPRALYRTSRNSASTGRRSYRLLAEILASYLATHTPDPRDAALDAGAAWGRFLTDRPAPFRTVDAASATRQLVEILDDLGFSPEPDTSGSEQRIILHQCPFREIADEHQDVVCAVHLGLMRGILSELGTPVRADDLEPFVEPDLCVTRLSNTERPSSEDARD